MYFEDMNGQLQITGAGLLMLIISIALLVSVIVEFVRKFFWYRSAYKQLKTELDGLENLLGAELPMNLEKYYQSRKKWEKKNSIW